MKNELLVLPEELAQMAEGVSIEKRNEVQSVLNKVFDGVAKMREQLDEITVEDENDNVNMKLCGTLRIGVKQERLAGEKIFDAKRNEVQQQMSSFKTEDSLWLKSKQVMQILTKEIEENAKWKQETAKRFEAEKIELKAQERILMISKYSTEVPRIEFENMSDESFTLFLAGFEKQYNDKIEAEKEIERKRIERLKAEAEEKAKMEAENKKLKAEVEAKDKANKIEAEKRDKVEAERILKEKQANQDRLKLEAKNQAVLKAEREKREKLEAEIKAKEATEEREKQLELTKGDAAKVGDLIKELESIKSKYSFKSAKNNKMFVNVCGLIDKVVAYI